MKLKIVAYSLMSCWGSYFAKQFFQQLSFTEKDACKAVSQKINSFISEAELC